MEAARARVGYTFLDVRSAPPALRRRRDLEIDLSAIAPGHATDVLSELLTEAGCPDHMVDVGGEVYARGRKADGSTWRIGIETPDPARPPGTSVSRVLRLENMAVSTSGDYRDFIEWQGHRYSHTFDPRTGAPVDHALASVTVLDRSTMWADGLATLLTVLGPTAGFEFAEAGAIPALFIERRESGFVERMTAPFADYLEGPSS
jgi:thiamine biosynthesis lipoprotein